MKTFTIDLCLVPINTDSWQDCYINVDNIISWCEENTKSHVFTFIIMDFENFSDGEEIYFTREDFEENRDTFFTDDYMLDYLQVCLDDEDDAILFNLTWAGDGVLEGEFQHPNERKTNGV